MRILLAFACFFKLLFAGKLPASAARYLPPPTPALPEPEPPSEKPPVAAGSDADKPAKPRPTGADNLGAQREGALVILGLLQREGRLIDFLNESLDDYEDADIGAAVRDIHRGCKQVLDDHLSVEPVMPGAEDDAVVVREGFDPGEVRLVGDISGDPPFKGVLRHHGWRVTKTKLPTLSEGVDRRVLAPAEVELS